MVLTALSGLWFLVYVSTWGGAPGWREVPLWGVRYRRGSDRGDFGLANRRENGEARADGQQAVAHLEWTPNQRALILLRGAAKFQRLPSGGLR